jgi:hypothetical protein
MTWKTLIWCIFDWLTNVLTPWSGVLLEKPVISQLINKFPAFYGTRSSITVYKAFMFSNLQVYISPIKVKVRLSLCLTKKHDHVFCLIKHHTLKTYWENGGITPRFLNLGIRYGGEWLASRPGHFLRSKKPRHRLDERVGGPQRRSGGGGERKKSHNCTRRELNPFRRACRPSSNIDWASPAPYTPLLTYW